jgi:hypothetical protein
VAGPQDNFQEARTALANGKRIIEAGIFLEKEEHQWKLILKGERFFFASCKTPKVTVERNAAVDEGSGEAAFYEKIFVLEQGLQLFESLYKSFLHIRISDKWPKELSLIEAWLMV